MSNNSTLNYKIRVLTAKTFRATKLYSSMKSSAKVENRDLGDLANDIKASAWYRAHAELQAGLTEALSAGNNTQSAAKIQSLKLRFEQHALKATQKVEANTAKLVESATRHEFASSLKSSLELIKIKAQAQAFRVIADELAEIVGADYKGQVNIEEIEEVVLENVVEVAKVEKLEKPSNVIPLRRRAQGGR